jgi:NADH-quinone oxidoreductase subunit C
MEHFGSPALRRLLEFFPSAVEATHADFGDATARVARGSLLEIMRLLRDEPGLDFEMLTDVTAVDYLGEEPRFEMVYHLYSVKRNHRVRVKSRVPEADPEIASLVSLWPSADWMEREVWDLYGIRFRGTTSFAPYETRITSATTDLAYEATAWRVSFGTRHGDNGKLDYIQGSLQARVGNRWAFRFSTDYNVDAGTIIENRFEVDFREQCWSITAAYVNRTTDDEFHITVNLLELGQYGFGRAFAGFGGQRSQ